MRAATYARVSTERQEKQETIESQLAALREHAKSKDLTVVCQYVDNGYSGELLARPELDKLRDDAKKGLFEVVLIHSPDRLVRKFAYQYIVEEDLQKSNVSIIYLNRPDAKDTPEDNLLVGVQGLIAEYEKTKIAERTRRGKLHKASKNLIVGSRAPYGYRYVREGKDDPGHYEIVREEAEVVKRIFKMVCQGQSIRAIAGELTLQRVKPPRADVDWVKKGKHWHGSTVCRILTNETYTGLAHYNKRVSVEPTVRRNGQKYPRTRKTSHRLRPTDEWVPIHLPDKLVIIDSPTFNRAQKQLALNSDRSPRNTKNHYLLRGLVRCGECDSPYVGIPSHDKLIYRCNNRRKRYPLPRTCYARSARADRLEPAVWNALTEAIIHPGLIAKHFDRLKERIGTTETELLEGIKSVDRDLADVTEEENRVLDAYTASIISLDQLRTQNDKIRAKKQHLEAQRGNLLSQLETQKTGPSDSASVEQVCRKIARRLKSIQEDVEAKRQIVTLLVTRIIIEGRKVRIRGAIPNTFPPREATSGGIAPPLSG